MMARNRLQVRAYLRAKPDPPKRPSGSMVGRASPFLPTPSLVNVEQVLAGEGAGYLDVVSAITYLKHPKYLEAFRSVAARRGLPGRVPNTICVADICRPDWL